MINEDRKTEIFTVMIASNVLGIVSDQSIASKYFRLLKVMRHTSILNVRRILKRSEI